jgi:hypothetical protein
MAVARARWGIRTVDRRRHANVLSRAITFVNMPRFASTAAKHLERGDADSYLRDAATSPQEAAVHAVDDARGTRFNSPFALSVSETHCYS